MNQVTVKASGSYDILIGKGLLPKLGEQARLVSKAEKVLLVSETNVYPLWGETAVSALESAGFQVFPFVFPAGEESKCPSVYLELLNALAENHLTRTDLIVALGGGVTGDLAGFAAATYLRGIPFVQIPTTLLAAVDSSVGGKTAIDLPAGKNLAGAFCQPCLVLCDLDLLTTLPEDIFRDGCAEVIKYGILYDPELFAHLEQYGPDFDRQWVITRCVELKRDVVEQDEFDRGLRMKLNLGHTVGHGVEAASHYRISHGRAVAIGTAIITRSAAAQGLCTKETEARILKLLTAFSLPTDSPYPPEVLAEFALSDKKRSGGSVRLIVPRAIGSCDILPIPVDRLNFQIKAGFSHGPNSLSP